VCGLKKFVNNCAVLNALSNFDILGLLETWGDISGQFNDLLEGYCCFDNVRVRQNNALRNSGGISVFVKSHLTKDGLVTRICSDFIDCIVLYLKVSCFNCPSDIILYIAYVSPEGSPIYEHRDDTNGITYIDEKLLLLKNIYPDCMLYLAGDLNARTKTMLDYIPADNIDFIFNSEVDYTTDDFEMPRNNKDNIYNSFGHTLLELCCAHGIHILNGRVTGDPDGEFTCITHNGASLVDYHIISTDLFQFVTKFNILSIDESDHFPICATMIFHRKNSNTNVDLPSSRSIQSNITDDNIKLNKFKWNDTLRDRFIETFVNMYNTCKDNIFHQITVDMNQALQTIVSLYKTAAENMKVHNRTKQRNVYERQDTPWWDNECDNLKYCKYKALRKFRVTSSRGDLQIYINEKRNFKEMCKNKKDIFQHNMRNRLCQARSNPNLFWQTIKSANYKKASHCSYQQQIKQSDWLNHFEKICS